MTTVRTKCPDCGTVDLQPSALKLVRGERVTYKFICPFCGRDVVKLADETIVELLLQAGVDWMAEVVMFHPEDPDLSAPLFTADDVLKLHEELEEL